MSDNLGIFQENIISVSEFNSLIKDVLANLGVFKVKGEVTEFKITQNNGVNITLSDGKANLRVGGYALSVKGIDLIEKGMDVIIEGAADLYVPYGSFSLTAFSIEPVGEGSLAIAYRKLKEKLEEEGLFALEHKISLPKFITKIALITAKDSAAYSDFIKILKENNVSLEISFYPVLVQGSKSIESIKNALKVAMTFDFDAVVLIRGGGSLEDLKSFNDEDIARLIFSSIIPVIVGVGHEKDESICDFVADVRASTPSQAAYYIIDQNNIFLDETVSLGDRIFEKIKINLDSEMRNHHDMILSLEKNIDNLITRLFDKVDTYERILKSFDVKNILKRGFALIQKNGKKILSAKEIEKGEDIETLLHDGKFNSIVKNIKYFD
jgi:exodeoxyribonuclease VII large subunit